MEDAINDLLATMRKATTEAKKLSLPIRPKAIYVSTTNTVDGVPTREDMVRPFQERMARPILIWRHLVEHGEVSPAEIAVYCDLKFDAKGWRKNNYSLRVGHQSLASAWLAAALEDLIPYRGRNHLQFGTCWLAPLRA